ncbi:MAG: mycodextranase, partial [Kiritimatiellaceae bacterium]|nr:mycodextranase [Kiritimatiellaceae bacterium]
MREMSHTTGWIGRVAAIAVSMLWMPLSSLGNVGAVVPFTTYEAELGSLGGGAQVLSMTNLPSAPTVELESSGRACVELNDVGESVTWTNTADCNAIVVRVSIPDSPTGGGITNTLNLYVNGVFRQSIAVNSLYTWIYEVTKFTNNNPSAGTPKRFYDMHRAFIVSNTVTAGSTIMLRKDAANTADYYRIDLIQLENVGSPISQPANTLNVTNYGAKANDQNDDSTAFKNCIAACESQGKGMWIPAGEFRTKEIISAEGINIYGAGMWYTTIHRVNGAAPNYRHKWDLTDCTIQDLYINIPQKSKQKIDGHDYGMTIQGTSSWRVERVWVHHGGAAFWCSGKDGTIKDCRSTESWADGINLNNSGSVQTTHRGLRLTCTNNYIIGPCDDGIALNAQNGSGTNWNMIDTKIRNNTSIAVNWANGIRIAGGRNSLVMHNLITDPTDSNGIRVGEFGGDGNPCESVLVCSNLVLRGCGIRTLYGHGGIAVTDDATAEIRANTILDSPGLGVDVQSCNATFIANVITRPYSNGFLVKASSIGTGIFTSNVVSGLRSGQVG